jgi:DNA polymerase-3 subunit epsilon
MPTSDAAEKVTFLEGTFIERPGFVFDTETTGVSAEDDRVVELGAVCVAGGKISGDRRMRINPGRPIPEGASAIHGIKDADVAGKPTFAEVADRFAMYLDGGMHGGVTPWLAGYNATGFDVPLLNAEFARIGSPARVDPARVVDPMVFVRWHLRHLRSRSLENVCRHFGIDGGRAHSALDDARATAELLLRMVAEGLIPMNIAEALHAQARMRAALEAEWQDFSYWLYHDRSDGRLRLGAGSHIGMPLADASPDYLRSLLSKIADLPERVRATFLTASSQTIQAGQTGQTSQKAGAAPAVIQPAALPRDTSALL